MSTAAAPFPTDIHSEPRDFDVRTLANLGPLTPLAGIWQGERGLDVKPKAEGARKQAYVERIELQPIDPQTNGPQLFYGLRYHTHVTKPGQVKTYHDQVGYWLWEPATGCVIHTLTIPRGQTAMAAGAAAADAKSSSSWSRRAWKPGASAPHPSCCMPFAPWSSASRSRSMVMAPGAMKRIRC